MITGLRIDTNKILSADLSDAYNILNSIIEDIRLEEDEELSIFLHQKGYKGIEEALHAIKYGVEINFSIYRLLSSEYTWKKNAKQIRIERMQVREEDFFEELDKRTSLIKSILLIYLSKNDDPTTDR